MAFYIKSIESTQAAIRRIANEQIDKAIAENDDASLDRMETVHQIRKRCKRIRGLLRLVRPAMEETYQRENAFFRDTARTLSDIRDSQSMLETYDQLLEHFGEQVNRPAFSSIRRRLTKNQRQLVDNQQGLQDRLAAFRKQIEDDAVDAIAAGVQKTYGRGRYAMKSAYNEPSRESFHEWRKRVKYHWFHARLLVELWPAIFQPFAQQAHHLSNLLGDEHDLAVIRSTVLDFPNDFGDLEDVNAFVGLASRRREQLQLAARPIGQRIFSLKNKAMANRLRRLFTAARSEA